MIKLLGYFLAILSLVTNVRLDITNIFEMDLEKLPYH